MPLRFLANGLVTPTRTLIVLCLMTGCDAGRKAASPVPPGNRNEAQENESVVEDVARDRALTAAPPAKPLTKRPPADFWPREKEESPVASSRVTRDFYRKTWAVIIGVNRYQDQSGTLTTLKNAVNDAKQVGNILTTLFGYQKNDVHLMLDEQASGSSVNDLLASLPVQEADSFLFYYAGHGVVDDDNRVFIAASDTQMSDLDATGISVDQLREKIDSLPCRHKALVIDSCYSGVLLAQNYQPAPSRKPRNRQSAPPTSPWAVDLAGKAFWGISSGRFQAVADSGSNPDHSPFTTALINQMVSASRVREDGVFTFQEIASAVEAAVAADNRQTPDWGRISPGNGNFLFRTVVESLDEAEFLRRKMIYQRDIEVAAKHYEQREYEQALQTLQKYEAERTSPDLRTLSWHRLWALLHRDEQVVKINHNSVPTPCFFPNHGGIFVLGSRTNHDQLFRLDRDGLEVIDGLPTGQRVSCTAKLNEDRLAIAADYYDSSDDSRKHRLLVWDFQSRSFSDIGRLSDSWVRQIIALADERTFVSLSQDRDRNYVISLWDTTADRPLRWQYQLERATSDISVSPNGRYLLAVGDRGSAAKGVTVIDLQKQQPVLSVTDDVSHATFVDDQRIATVFVRSLKLRGFFSEAEWVSPTKEIEVPAGSSGLARRDDHSLWLWGEALAWVDHVTNQVIDTPIRVGRSLTSVKVDDDGRWLAISKEGELRVVPLSLTDTDRTIQLNAAPISLVRGTSSVHVQTKVGWFEVNLSGLTDTPDAPTDVANRVPLTLDEENQVVRRVSDGAPLPLMDTGSEVSVARLAPLAETIVGGCLDGTVRMWDARTGSHELLLGRMDQPIDDICVSEDESLVVIASASDATITVFQTRQRPGN